MGRLLIVGCTVLGLVLAAVAHEQQVHRFSSPEVIVQSALHTREEDELRLLARRLQTFVRFWRSGSIPEDPLCFQYSAAKMDYVVLRQPGPQAVIQLDSSICRFKFLVVLDKDKGGGWRLLATVPLIAWHGFEQEVTFEELIKRGEQEIIVRHQLLDWGTGIQQVNLMVFKLFGDGLDLVFSETESLIYAIPETDQAQKSEFAFIPGTHSLKDIFETQTIKDGETELVRWKLHWWVPELRRFLSSPIYGPTATQE